MDPPCDGAWNMAVDQALLESVAKGAPPIWRFYQWAEPTLSLGYFQDYADREKHPASRACRIVRRASGGGAILHDAELTYSLALPADHPLAIGRLCLYCEVHRSLIEALTHLGVSEADLSMNSVKNATENPFLCFQRRAEGDVLLGTTKIAGSAQRRVQGAVLQHGSILLRQSTVAPELKGIVDLSGVAVDADRLIEAWTQLLGDHLHLNFYPDPLSPGEQTRAEQLVRDRYGLDKWTQSRQKTGPGSDPN
jgi:lipoate-protein ligase A